MKKLIVAGMALAGLVALVAWGRSFRLANPWLDGKMEKVARGDLVIPVSASGSIQANKQVEIKSKASGEVAHIHVVAGQMVKAGDILLELDPIDETRNVDRAQAELDRANAAHEQTVIRLDEARRNRPLDVEVAEALRDQAAVQVEQAQIEYDKLAGVQAKTEIEVRRIAANLNNAKANLKRAEAELGRARNNETIMVRSAEEDVAAAHAVLDSAKKALDEAKQRLIETKIYSPIDGLVYSIRVHEGEIVQGGKSTLMSGTPLMYLADISRIYIIAQVDGSDIGAVRKIAPEFARPGQTREVPYEELIASAPLPPASQPLEDGTNGGDPPAEYDEIDTQKVSDLVHQRVRISVGPDLYEGIIERILPEPRTVSNVITFDVRILMIGDNLHHLLGLDGDVQFTADRVTGVLKVKNESLVSEGKDVFVYVPWRESDSSPWDEKKVPVTIGMTDGNDTHIVTGLKEGDDIWVKRPQKTDREKEKSRK